MRTGAEVRILGFADINYGGECVVITGTGTGLQGNITDLTTLNVSGTNWNDRISSFRVVNAPTVCPGA